MVDAWLIVLCIIVPFILTFLNMLFMAHYIHKDEAGGSKLPKFVVLLGLLFAECAILLLPLDAGNRSGVVGCGFWNNECGGLNMVLVWEIVYCAVAIMVIIVVPFTVFYYEADSGEMNMKEKLWWTACKYLTVTLVISVGLLVVGFAFLRTTYIPISTIAVDVTTVAFQPVTTQTSVFSFCGVEAGCTITSEVLNFDVTFVIYMASLLSFAGWFLFVVYAAIGIVAMPMDFLHGFTHRRKLLSSANVARYKVQLRERAERLNAVGQQLKTQWEDYNMTSHGRFERRRAKQQHQVEMNKFRVMVDALEDEYEDLLMSSPENFGSNNPLYPWFSLFMFFLTIIVSLLWITHIVLYMLIVPAISPFLNDYLQWFDTWFPLFGTLSIAFFSLYLLAVVIKGNHKFGTRFFLITIHPMRPHKTYMNSFVFNVALILLCALPVVQFCTEAFASYARLTDADLIFGTQVRNLQFFRYFWQNNVFLYAMLFLAFLSLIYFVCSPSSDKERMKREDAKLRIKLQRDKTHQLKAIKRTRV